VFAVGGRRPKVYAFCVSFFTPPRVETRGVAFAGDFEGEDEGEAKARALTGDFNILGLGVGVLPGS
jgi:hypothetical protein